MRRRWGHGHSLGAGVLAGIAFTSYRVWLLLAVAFLLGILVDRLLVNWRSAKATAAELLDGRERRANVNTILRRRASERADVRLSLLRAREANRAAVGGPGELPEDY